MADDSGLPLVRLDNLPNSRRPLEASEYARAHGKHEEFHRIVFRKLYGEGQDVSKWEVLREAAREVGLDAEEMQLETDNGNYRDILDARLEKAHALGITAVPTYIINDKYSVEGAQPFEVFEQVLQRLAGKRK
jgi:predicted DsbA family dithiol-disulfide isomerase